MAVDIMTLNLLVGTMAQHAFDHRADLGGRTAFELRVDAGRLALHVPVNHDAPAAVADMPFRHQILVPGPHLRRIRRAGSSCLAPDALVRSEEPTSEPQYLKR